MADIKTRDVVKGTIKKIDKAAIAADRMRSAYVQTKTSLDKGTQRKTTENELPSLTQCTA